MPSPMPAGQPAEPVAHALEHEAHEDPVHRPEAAEVARGVGPVGAAALPVGHPLGADHHLADVGLGARPDPLGVQGAGRDLALRAAHRRVGHVGDRQPVPRVEEARRAALRAAGRRPPGPARRRSRSGRRRGSW